MIDPLSARLDADLLDRLRNPAIHTDEDGNQHTLTLPASVLVAVRTRILAGGHEDLEPLFAAAIDDILANGQRQLNAKTHEFEVVRPSAAMLKLIAARVKDIEQQKGPPPTSAHLQVLAAMEKGEMKLPSLDTDADDPATNGRL